MDWRMFKLLRLWNLSTSEERFILRDIPPEKRDFNSRLTDDKKLVALFDKSVKHLLIETYGLDCYRKTDEGLFFEIDYFNQSFMVNWLLGFGDKVKVLEPPELVTEIKSTAKNILSHYL
jgi:predicted DNA-binding transcriptional regulator YafY